MDYLREALSVKLIAPEVGPKLKMFAEPTSV
jgi:hypothetical protein